jgi:hypothetical protein
MSVRSGLVVMSAAVAGSSALQYAALLLGRALPRSRGLWGVLVRVDRGRADRALGDLGISVSLVRTGSQRPAALPEALAAAIAWRVLLLLPVGIVAYWACASARPDRGVAAVLLPLWLATFCDGIGTLCSSAYQAQERWVFRPRSRCRRNLVRGGRPARDAWRAAAAPCAGLGVLSRPRCSAALPRARRAAGAARGSCSAGRSRADAVPALPFGIAILATILHGQLDVILLGRLGDAAEVGRYHASARFVVLAQMIPQVSAVATAPAAYRVGSRGACRERARVPPQGDGARAARPARGRFARRARRGLCTACSGRSTAAARSSCSRSRR